LFFFFLFSRLFVLLSPRALSLSVSPAPQAKLNAMSADMEQYKQSIVDGVTALGARLTAQAEVELLNTASVIISRHFPTATVTEWKVLRLTGCGLCDVCTTIPVSNKFSLSLSVCVC
jgi:hypothetical protein